MKYQNIREEELKNKVREAFFSGFDATKIVGNIDFCVVPQKAESKNQTNLFSEHSLLWAEAKTGDFDVVSMFVQLILTIGRARTFDKYLPPAFLGTFDFKKIAFIPYNSIQDIFYTNDFNWNVTPSNHDTKEFNLICQRIESILHSHKYEFDFTRDETELKHFIKNNIAKATEAGKIQIDKNNFVPIYLRWLEQVKPTIEFPWDEGKKQHIHDSDFYLADLFVDDRDTTQIEDDTPLKNDLFIVFRDSRYEIQNKNLHGRLMNVGTTSFRLKNKNAYEQFWKKYKRPPLKEFQEYIIERKDLLVPQDIRERKGAFFTPRKWVELSQQYIADVLGENWQEEYYVWDCAAGTGNLLAGLTNKYNIYASTLDMSDVNAMHDRINHGANLLESHVFQFDFLNDDFSKLPQGLQDIINDEEKRKKLLIYINPPYAEAGDIKQRTGTGKNKTSVAHNKTHDKYHNQLSGANRELFAQFLIRIYCEIPHSKIANFSTLKNLQSSHFSDFRQHFRAKLEKIFLVPADTFDNVKGKFPIGFFIWDISKKEKFREIIGDIYDKNGEFFGIKKLISYEDFDYFSKWVNSIKLKSGMALGWLQGVTRNDFQNQNGITIRNQKEQIAVPRGINIYDKNFIECCVCYAVRMCIEATWLNDRDQFLYPNDGWEKDKEFQNDCLAYTLFTNNIQSKFGINHWIPFTEKEVNARDVFASHFMTDFIKGKKTADTGAANLFDTADTETRTTPLFFSAGARAVFDAGCALYTYYHAQPGAHVNASLYDIREHFQGRNEKGKMNNKSEDETYTKLIGALREKLKQITEKIAPKVYEYGFLKQ